MPLPLPWQATAPLSRADLRTEAVAGLAVAVMSVPQGIAYAMVAGLPPAMGLYAGAVPAIVGALFRSSRLVVVGPTNALSLVFATAIAARADDPVAVAATLALLVGVLQIAAGLLRLHALVDFISAAVVTGYITGAATLIAVGQLPHVTGTPATSGDIFTRTGHWVASLPATQPLSLAVAVGTVLLIALLRTRLPRGLPALVVLGAATAASAAFDLRGRGVTVIADLAPVPVGLPPLTLPELEGSLALGSVAVAAMVLSLVESTSVSRALAAQTGERVDVGRDFVGMGAANLAAAFTGAYPVSGSLARSALNHANGARTRLAGALSGAFVLVVLLGLGPVVDHTPVAAVAGLIIVVVRDLVDPEAIRSLWHSGLSDRWAFAGTVLGTWMLPLDQAIYLGVGISIVLFLRRARLLTVREFVVDRDLHLREVDPDESPTGGPGRCGAIRVLQVEGPLFFASASELEAVLTETAADPAVRVVVVRLKRAQGVDYTAGRVLARIHDDLAGEGRHLLLVGMREDMMRRLEDIGVAEAFDAEELFPTQPGWFVAMNQALEHALDLVEAEGPGHAADCPFARYLEASRATP